MWKPVKCSNIVLCTIYINCIKYTLPHWQQCLKCYSCFSQTLNHRYKWFALFIQWQLNWLNWIYIKKAAEFCLIFPFFFQWADALPAQRGHLCSGCNAEEGQRPDDRGSHLAVEGWPGTVASLQPHWQPHHWGKNASPTLCIVETSKITMKSLLKIQVILDLCHTTR